MIKLSKNQLLASGFVKIVMNIVFIIFLNYNLLSGDTTLFFSQRTQLHVRTAVSPAPISDEISLDIR